MLDEHIARERQQREQEYKALVDGMKDTAFVSDFDGRFIEVNNAAVEVLGYSREELLSMGPQDIDPLNDAEDIMRLIEEKKTGVTQVFETRHTKKNGDQFPVEVCSTLVTYQGELKILSIVRDLSERKKVEEQLKLTQYGIDNAQIGVFQVDDDGNIYYANKYASSRLGYADEELRALKIWDIDANLTQERWQAHRTRTRSQGTSSIESVHRRKDGTEFPVEVAIDFIEFENKRISISFSLDITERKQAERERELLLEQIRDQAQQLREVMSTVPEGLFLLDAEHKVVLANPIAEEILATLAGAKMGDTLTCLGDRPLAELLASPATAGLRHEVSVNNRTFEVAARQMSNSSNPENWVVVVNDITLERQVQEQFQQQERLAALGQLAAGIAHDFNNIMAVIVLYAQMGLHLPDLPTGLRGRLDIIAQQAKYATDLIQQILDFGRRAVLERHPIALAPFLEEQIALLQRTLPEHIAISFSHDEGDYIVDVDATRMQQAVMNLALNARDAMENGGRLSLELANIYIGDGQKAPLPDMDAGEWIRLTVTDTGTGIPPDVIPHIFDPFFSTKAPGKGIGLGLPQVYGIVKQHGGYIDVKTALGKGTSFILYLPALTVTPTHVCEPEPEALALGHGETILVVEDNHILQKALQASIAALNYRVLTANTGLHALDILDEHADIALVVSDLVMPEMGGQALFHALRRRGSTLPVVMLSGHPMEDELASLQAQGLAGWLLKPPNIEQLAQLLAQALKQK